MPLGLEQPPRKPLRSRVSFLSVSIPCCWAATRALKCSWLLPAVSVPSREAVLRPHGHSKVCPLSLAQPVWSTSMFVSHKPSGSPTQLAVKLCSALWCQTASGAVSQLPP